MRDINRNSIKKGTSLSLVLGLALCAFGLFMISSIKIINPRFDRLFTLLKNNLCLIHGQYALVTLGVVAIALGIFTLYARGKRAFFHLVTFAVAFFYISLVAVVNNLYGLDTPVFLVSRMKNLSDLYLAAILVCELVTVFVVFKLASFLNHTEKHDQDQMEEIRKENVVNKSKKELRKERREMRAAKKALKKENKRMRELERQQKAEEKLRKREARLEDKRQKAEKRKEEETIRLQEEVIRAKKEEKRLEIENMRRERDSKAEREKEWPKVNNSSSLWVPSYQMQTQPSDLEVKKDPFAMQSRPIEENPVVTNDSFSSRKQPEKRAGLFFSSIAESVDKSMEESAAPRPNNVGPIKGFYEEEDAPMPKNNGNGIAPSNLSPSHPRYKMFESLKNSNPRPVTLDEKKNEKENFAPSNLSPDHPRYKLFESLKKTPEENRALDRAISEKREAAIQPKQEEKAFAPSNLSPDHPRYKLFEALKKKPSEKAPVKEVYGEEEVLDIGETTETFAPEPEHKRRVVYESVRTSDNVLPRDTGYYQKESTAKGINGFVVEDVKPREVPLTKSQEVEFQVGIAGLSSNEAGLDAIRNRQRRGYNPPPVSLLSDYPSSSYDIDERTHMIGKRIQDTMGDFRVEVYYKNAVKGPSVTMFCYDLAPGIMVNAVKRLEQNIKLAIGGKNVRILAPIPGRSEIGVEVPNDKVATVGFKELLPTLSQKSAAVPLLLGRNIYGEPQLVDVAKTPHLLIAGTTGSGKSVCINSLIASILYSKSPKDVRLIMVDPKVVELTVYNGLPHLLTPVITDNKRVLKMLSWLCEEMERRYSLLSQLGLRKIDAYNERIHEMGYATEKLPYIVLIMDEYADLMLTVGKEMEGYLQRLLQKARAAGIHVVLATQRPSAQVVTGVIKANIPARIAFRVASGIDSSIILGEGGAENLLGRGDMLMNVGYGTNRLQGCFLSDDEVFEIVRYAKTQGEPDYLDESIFEDDVDDDSDDFSEGSSSVGADGDLYERAKAIIWERKCASASYLQRRLGIGYNKAARIVEQMEEEGLVGPANGSKPREVLRYE